MCEMYVAEYWRKGRIVSEQFHPELNLVDWTLSNGARVIYRQSALSRNKVGISGCRAGGFSALDSTDYYNGIFADLRLPYWHHSIGRERGYGDHVSPALPALDAAARG